MKNKCWTKCFAGAAGNKKNVVRFLAYITLRAQKKEANDLNVGTQCFQI